MKSHSLVSPLLLKPDFYSKVWGGNRIPHERTYDVEIRGPIGEAWITWGGSQIVSSPWQGEMLDNLVSLFGSDLIGQTASKLSSKRFPLMAKLLSVESPLSIQVHPGQFSSKTGATGYDAKNEMWYILESNSGSYIYFGPTPGKELKMIRHLLEEGDVDAAVSKFKLHAGDVIMIPAGTIHSIGGGVLVYEIQQASTTTFRLFDWKRDSKVSSRDLQIEEGLQHADLQTEKDPRLDPVSVVYPWGKRSYLGACLYFAVEMNEICGQVEENTWERSAHILTMLEGNATINSDHSEEQFYLKTNETALIPACMTPYTIRSDGQIRVIKSYVPDLKLDIVCPLLAHNIPPKKIINLAIGRFKSDISREIS
jgi:mannose-6-phosphate isomerase